MLDNTQFQAVHTKVKNMIIVFFLHRQCDGKCTLCNSAREAISTDDNDEDDECDHNDDTRRMLIRRMMMQAEGGSVPMAKHPVTMSQSTLAHL